MKWIPQCKFAQTLTLVMVIDALQEDVKQIDKPNFKIFLYVRNSLKMNYLFAKR